MIDGFDVDLPDSAENAAEFGYAGSGGGEERRLYGGTGGMLQHRADRSAPRRRTNADCEPIYWRAPGTLPIVHCGGMRQAALEKIGGRIAHLAAGRNPRIPPAARRSRRLLENEAICSPPSKRRSATATTVN
jgi:hypothetical protein